MKANTETKSAVNALETTVSLTLTMVSVAVPVIFVDGSTVIDTPTAMSTTMSRVAWKETEAAVHKTLVSAGESAVFVWLSSAFVTPPAVGLFDPSNFITLTIAFDPCQAIHVV